MEVKIGVADHGRELLVSVTAEPEEIEALVAEAVADDERMLVLVDDKGKRILVPSKKIAYVEIAASDTRRVGFGS